MRLFTAIDLERRVRETLTHLLEHLRPTANLRWTRPENLHLTLKFIGQWPDQELPRLQEALQDVPPPSPFQLAFRGLGFFPNPRSPRVFWAGLEPSPGLANLAASIDDALAALGIAREQRAYSPHLTLARVPERRRVDPLHRAIEGLPSLDFGSFSPDRFYLYQSRPGPGGSVYTRLQEFPWRQSEDFHRQE